MTDKQIIQQIVADYRKRHQATGAGTDTCRFCRGKKEASRFGSNLCRSCDYGGTKLCLVCRAPGGPLCELHAADERTEVFQKDLTF